MSGFFSNKVYYIDLPKKFFSTNQLTVNSEILVRILFSQIALKGIFAKFKNISTRAILPYRVGF